MTIVFVTPHLSRFEFKIDIRPNESSFAIIPPALFIMAAACVVLLPGLAHKSNKKSFSFGKRARRESIEEIS